jgi:hypothetical protein
MVAHQLTLLATGALLTNLRVSRRLHFETLLTSWQLGSDCWKLLSIRAGGVPTAQGQEILRSTDGDFQSLEEFLQVLIVVHEVNL